MKTNRFNKQGLLASFLVILAMGTLKGQKCPSHLRPGFQAGSHISGDGHGTTYRFAANVKIHRHTFALGPTYQKMLNQFNGIGFTYSYSVTGVVPNCHQSGYYEAADSNTELYFFVSLQGCKGAALSKNTLREEGKLTEEMRERYTSMRLNTIESYVGIGCNFKLGRRFYLRSFVGVGGYTHLDFSEPMYHSRSALSLMTGIGIGFNKY